MRPRTTASAALALVLAISFFLPCFDFCPEEEGSEVCPPVCVSCLGCPRTSALAPSVAGSIGVTDTFEAVSRGFARCALPILPDDIPHIPLSSVA